MMEASGLPQQQQPKREAASAGRAYDGAVADGDAQQEHKEGVDTNIHAEKSADRK